MTNCQHCLRAIFNNFSLCTLKCSRSIYHCITLADCDIVEQLMKTERVLLNVSLYWYGHKPVHFSEFLCPSPLNSGSYIWLLRLLECVHNHWCLIFPKKVPKKQPVKAPFPTWSRSALIGLLVNSLVTNPLSSPVLSRKWSLIKLRPPRQTLLPYDFCHWKQLKILFSLANFLSNCLLLFIYWVWLIE